MARLFISYRRDDSAGFAGRLTDALERIYGDGSVFRDVDDIPPGEDFAQVIQRGVEQVAAVLVMIGPGWLDASDGGERRLDRADDFVRREIEGALAAGKPLLPVLVGGAQMPSADRLPAAIRPLAARQALALRDASWKADVAALQAALTPLLGATAAARGGQAPGERVTAPMVDSTPAAGRRRLLIAIGLGAAAGLAAYIYTQRTHEPAAPAVEGAWRGRVAYPWGANHDERFEFTVRDGAISGSASFLGLPRTIEAGEIRDGRLHFSTRSTEVLGDAPPRDVVHRYVGEPGQGEIRVTLESRGGYSANPPTRFVLRRGN